MTNEIQINEVFDLASAKGYDYEITDMSTVTIPEIKFQATFEADNGVEYAFRVYRADSMAGRKYGPHSRLLVFMRKKSRNFSQGITIDMGTFKKVLVTFMRCYKDYKEESKDGKKSSSYAVVMPDTMRPYASLFVRANRRAFKNNKRIHLNLVGVNEEGKGNTIELMFVNSQSMFPYFGGKDYDAAKFEGNDTHVKLAKLDGKEVELAPPVNTQANTVASPTPTPQPAAVVAPPQPTRDKFNPDGIPGLNDPANFSQQFVMDAFMAKGRDALEAVFKQYKIHRRYFAANIAKAVDMWRTEYDVKRDYSHGNPDDIKDGVGFYIRRELPQLFPEFMSVIVRANMGVTIDSLQRWVDNDELKTIGMNSPIVPVVTDTFILNYLLPVSAGVAEEYQKIKSTFEKLGVPFDRLRRSALINASSNPDQVMIASIVLNAIDPVNISDVNIINQYSEDKTGGKLILHKDKYDMVVEALKLAKVSPQYKVELVAPISINGSDYQDVIAAYVTGDIEKIQKVLIETYRLNVKSDESHAALQGIVATVKANAHHLDPTKMFSNYSEMLVNAYTRGSNPFYGNIKTILIAFINSLSKVTLYQIPANSRYDQEFIRDSSIVGALVNVMFSNQSECLAEFRVLVDEWETMHTDELSKYMVDRAGELGFIDTGFVTEVNGQIRRNISSYRSRYSSPEQSLPRLLYRHLNVGEFKDMYSLYSSSIESTRHDLIARIVSDGKPRDVAEFAEAIAENGDVSNFSRVVNQATHSVKNAPTAAAVFNKIYEQGSHMKNMPRIHETAQALKFAISRGAFSESLNGILEFIPEHELKVHIRNNPACLRFTSSDDQFADDIPAFAVNAAIEGINMSEINKVNSNWGEVAPNQLLVDYIASINSDMLSKMSDSSIDKLKTIFSNIRATSTSRRTTYQPMLDRMSDILAEADLSSRAGLSQELLDSIDDRERRLLVKSVGKNFFINRYIDELRNHSSIKMNVGLNQKSIASILNFNNISIAKLPSITEKDDIEKVKKKVGKLDLGVPEEKVVKVELTREQLDDLTIEYDAFNRKLHNLSLVFDEAFTVSIPKQVEGRAAWDAKMEAEGINSKIMYPVFHGTGSIAAAMILRLGFAVASIDETKKTGVKTAGRALGDGIYFSTAIDKIAQYASDGGFGRRLGAEGYIFEMNASLGKARRDYREAGTGSRIDEHPHFVSPEWAVMSPNDQLVISKAYKIRRVPHHVLDRLKRNRKNVNESKNVTAIRGFRDVIRESLDYGVNEKMITFIFGDGMIPVGNGQLVDFDSYDNELGDTVRVEGGQLGAMVTFTQLSDNDQSDVDIYHVALTEAFVYDDPLKDMYFKLVQRAIKV